MRTSITTAAIFTAAGFVCAYSQEFEIVRHAVDSGGVIRRQGGDLKLSGSIGQPEVGRLTGGGFELSGGFWIEIPPSDCNDDGAVNLLDHFSFSECLGGPKSGMAPGCNCFDTNQDGAVDLRDFGNLQLVSFGP